MSSRKQELELSKQGAVAWLTLNRPTSLNALTEALIAELAVTAKALSEDPSVRVVVLRGRGGNFCSGLDLRSALPAELSREDARTRLESFQRAIRAIVHCPKPFIACVEGAAVGFGADLALCCDFRVFATSGYLQEKFVDIGLMPDGGGTFWLPHFVGLGKALEFLMLGERIDAQTALALGLATRVVGDEATEATCQELSARLASKAPLALAAIKAATREAATDSLAAALEREKQGQSRLLVSDDFREGVLAWVERRLPDFKGS